MNPESLIGIQSELAQIRAILLPVSIIGGIVLILAMFRASLGIYFDLKKVMAKQFETVADILLRENRLPELKTHVQERLKTQPNHEYAHWYLARAFYLEGDHEGASREFVILENLCPSWKADHIEPFLQTMKSQNEPAKSCDR